jgi:hypothetical protein
MSHARNSELPSRHRHSSVSVLAVIASAVAIAACGASSASPSASGSVATAQGIKATDCMRSHGVPNLPDPSSGGGIHIPDGSTINAQSPAFQAALHACAKLLPGGGPGSHHASKQDKIRALQIAQCMRQHGVSGFPDPMIHPPSNPADYSELQNKGGLITGIPKTINIESPAFKQAAAACRF